MQASSSDPGDLNLQSEAPWILCLPLSNWWRKPWNLSLSLSFLPVEVEGQWWSGRNTYIGGLRQDNISPSTSCAMGPWCRGTRLPRSLTMGPHCDLFGLNGQGNKFRQSLGCFNDTCTFLSNSCFLVGLSRKETAAQRSRGYEEDTIHREALQWSFWACLPHPSVQSPSSSNTSQAPPLYPYGN